MIEFSDTNPPPWKRNEDRLARYIAADDLDRHDAQSFVPDVSVRKFVAGDFLCYGELELPRGFIGSIEPGQYAGIFSRGGNSVTPHLSLHPGVGAVKARCAGVKITMHSGQTHTISCNRWQTDILLDALRDGWKHGIGLEETEG